MSEPEDVRPGPLERAYRQALETEAAVDDADRQRRRAAVLARVAALETAQRQQRMSSTAANRPYWLMLGGSALALVLSAGLVWQLGADKDAEPLAGASMEGVKVAAAPTPSPQAPAVVQAPPAVPPVNEASPPRRAARSDSVAKTAKPQAQEVWAAAAPVAEAAPAAAAAADVTVAQAPLPAMRDLAQAPAAPAAAMRQRAETMAMPSGAAALHTEPTWVALIRNDDRAGLRAALEAGLDVDASDAQGRTPLMYAAIHARPELIAELLARSASRARVDRFGLTAEMYAARSPDPRVRAALAEGR
nr:ankyrin repeat domain-containing protein [uncultured Roseateles sp.]